MATDYRNLLVSKKRVDWSEIKSYERDLHNVYEMKIKHGYIYFVYTTDHHIFAEEYLQQYKPNVILIHQNENGSTIDLMDYNGCSRRTVDCISDDLVNYEDLTEVDHLIAIDSFMELLEGALIKVYKFMELSDEEIEIIPTVFKFFMFNYDELDDNIKSKVVRIY